MQKIIGILLLGLNLIASSLTFKQNNVVSIMQVQDTNKKYNSGWKNLWRTMQLEVKGYLE